MVYSMLRPWRGYNKAAIVKFLSLSRHVILTNSIFRQGIYVTYAAVISKRLMSRIVGYGRGNCFAFETQFNRKHSVEYQYIFSQYEGEPGLEPGTARSAVECSTTELHPPGSCSDLHDYNV